MSHPWDSDSYGSSSDSDTNHSHNISETKQGNYKCKRCGKMATAKGKLSKTRCNPDRERSRKP